MEERDNELILKPGEVVPENEEEHLIETCDGDPSIDEAHDHDQK